MKRLRLGVIFKHAEDIAQLPLLKAEVYIETKQETIVAELNHIARLAIELRGHAIHFLQLQLARTKHFRALLVELAQSLAQHFGLIRQALPNEIIRAAFQRG